MTPKLHYIIQYKYITIVYMLKYQYNILYNNNDRLMSVM